MQAHIATLGSISALGISGGSSVIAILLISALHLDLSQARLHECSSMEAEG
jgi:hypothetical protein